MSSRTYAEFDLLAEKAQRDQSGLRGMTVRLLASPAGDVGPIRRTVSAGLARQLTARLTELEARPPDTEPVMGLGAALADLLLPSAIRQVLVTSLDGLGPDDGLRIRLRLDPGLAELPWEYIWVPRQQGQRDSSGFLALDPRVSIVRHETVGGRVAIDPTPRDRRVVAVFDNPNVPGRAPLDLPAERLNLETALRKVPGTSVEVYEDVTIDGLEDALLDGADVFHFAGHGLDDSLVLVDDAGAPWQLPAQQLAMNLRGRGAQLVVLGACESAMRARRDPWSGVATRLIAAGVPAVVAMQYRIGDRTAIAFSERLYRSLAAGLSLDEAVFAGRLAIFNETTGGRGDPKRARLWRDWGVPVVYLRPEASVSLISIVDDKERERAVEDLDSTVRLRARTVRKGGKVTGLEAGVIRRGRFDVAIETGDVEGTVIGLDADKVEGGTTSVDIVVGDVGEEGKVTGMTIGSTGGRRPTRRRRAP